MQTLSILTMKNKKIYMRKWAQSAYHLPIVTLGDNSWVASNEITSTHARNLTIRGISQNLL